MKSKLVKTLRIVAAGVFVIALVMNVLTALSEPFCVEIAHASLTDDNGNPIDDSNGATSSPTTGGFGLPECPGETICDGQKCIMTNHIERFLSNGCKAKCGYVCVFTYDF